MSIFITLEGPDGSGKTTIAKKIVETLETKGYQVVFTREPGGISISEQIRDIILNKENTEMDGRTEALLYAASRRQHIAQKILPALKENKIVICDRFLDSSLAYQGVGRNIGIDEVMSINQFAIDNVMPVLTIYFDISPEIGIQRINANKNREVNRLDLEKMAFHSKVRDGYLKLVERFPNRIKKIDASLSIENVYNEAMKHINKVLEQK